MPMRRWMRHTESSRPAVSSASRHASTCWYTLSTSVPSRSKRRLGIAMWVENIPAYSRMAVRLALVRRYGPYGRYGLHPDVQPYLHAARPADGGATEERALQQVLVVEHILDVQLGPQHRAAHHQRVPRA